MASALLIVHSNAVEGRRDDFNDWYSEIHIRDIMRMPGARGVQRFGRGAEPPPTLASASDLQFEFLTLYEVSDPRHIIEAHRKDMFTDRLPIADALNFDSLIDCFYMSAMPGVDGLDAYTPPAGDVLLISLVPTAAPSEFENWYLRECHPHVLSTPGVESGELYRAGTQQSYPTPPEYPYVALYRTSDRQVALQGLDANATRERIAAGPIRTSATLIECFGPLIERLASERVVAASPEERDREARARVTLGDRVHAGEEASS